MWACCWGSLWRAKRDASLAVHHRQRRLLVDVEPSPDATDLFERYLAETIVCAPISTLRGGTTEVLRTLIARRLLGPLK